MATLPASGYLSNAARTGGEQKTAFEALRDVIAQLPGGSAITTLTIATGSVTPTLGIHAIDTEAAAASDDLTNIVQTNLPDGSLIIIRNVNAARVVVVKHSAGGSGQISLKAGVDFVLDDPGTWLILRRSSALWEEVGRLSAVTDRIPTLTKTGAYTVVAQDLGKLIDATTGSWTLSLTAAATLGNGFWFAVKAGAGTITIDPNGAETVDGNSTLALAPGDSAVVICTGSAWKTIGRSAFEAGTWSGDLGPSGSSARALNTNYQNTSGKKRRVLATVQGATASPLSTTGFIKVSSPADVAMSVHLIRSNADPGTSHRAPHSFEVPANWYYRIVEGGGGTLLSWFEMDE